MHAETNEERERQGDHEGLEGWTEWTTAPQYVIAYKAGSVVSVSHASCNSSTVRENECGYI